MRLLLTRLVSAAVIGAVVGLAIGYTVYILSDGYVSFRSWIKVTGADLAPARSRSGWVFHMAVIDSQKLFGLM
jgi:hypothetical protein